MMPDEAQKVFFVEERQTNIKEYIDREKHVTVHELSQYFNVSPSTIRNDLTLLESEGLIHRTHGGAVSINTIRVSEVKEPAEREETNSRFKNSIARMASKEVQDGDTIGILGGSTSFTLVKALTDKQHLTIVTNDLKIASWVDENTDFDLYVLGGFVKKKFHLMNILTSRLENINLDKVFFASNGFDIAKGATISDVNTALAFRAVIGQSGRCIYMCDSSKIGNIAFAKIVDTADIDVFITDANISSIAKKALMEQEDLILRIAEKED